jgi:hypothetical protein
MIGVESSGQRVHGAAPRQRCSTRF